MLLGNNKFVEKFLEDLLSELNKKFPDKGRKLPAFALVDIFLMLTMKIFKNWFKTIPQPKNTLRILHCLSQATVITMVVTIPLLIMHKLGRKMSTILFSKV